MATELEVKKDLQRLVNVGPAIAGDLYLLGIRKVEDLKERTADDLYQELCVKTAERQDPCVWDTFASVVDQAKGNPGRPWWEYTPLRKDRKL